MLTSHYARELAQLVAPVAPDMPRDARLRLVNHALADELQLPGHWWQTDNVTGLLCSPMSELSRHAVAQKYGGHQFGQWNPMLGDGRGVLLGEVTSASGKLHDLHLKGAGMTPYSRQGDGRAVLRSTLREYIGSEALHHLGIPSSRALCLFDSPQTVLRETAETAALMIRTAPSHIRFGHFEYYYNTGDTQALNALFDFVFTYHFSELKEAANPHQALLKAITLRTARMIALWQAYGYVHGVMNTDNMSIHGITFDYGPYAMLDNFVSNSVFNHSDLQGRYAFDQQPGVALWNLNALARAFSGHCTIDEIKAVLQMYEPTFMAQYQQIMMQRLGLDKPSEQTLSVLNAFMRMVADEQRDYTATLRKLSHADPTLSHSPLRDEFIDREGFDAWWQQYRALRQTQGNIQNSQQHMLNTNPVVIPRTYYLQQVIDDARQGDYTTAKAMIEAVSSPFSTKWENTRWAMPPTDDSQVSLSCSS